MHRVVGKGSASSNIHLVYIPENSVEALERESDFNLAEDEIVSAASTGTGSGIGNAGKHQTIGNPAKDDQGFTAVSNIGVAVLDTGVTEHSDLNIASQYDVVARSRAETMCDKFDNAYSASNAGRACKNCRSSKFLANLGRMWGECYSQR